MSCRWNQCSGTSNGTSPGTSRKLLSREVGTSGTSYIYAYTEKMETRMECYVEPLFSGATGSTPGPDSTNPPANHAHAQRLTRAGFCHLAGMG